MKSTNATEHSALFKRDPDDVAGDKDLQFDLRYKNAEMRETNVQLSKTRGENLEQQGAFRTFLAPTTGFRRRAGQQNWSEKYIESSPRAPTAEWRTLKATPSA